MRGQRREISVSGALVWFAAAYGAALLGFLGVSAAAGRWLGPQDFGFFAAALAGAALLGQVGLIGSHRSGLREAARLRDGDDPRAMAELRNGVRAVSLATLPAAGLVGAVVTWAVTDEQPDGTRWTLAAALGVLVVLTGQQQLWANYARGLGHVRIASLLEGRSGGALVAGLQAVLVLLAWRLLPTGGLALAVAAMAGGYLLPVLGTRRMVRRHWHHLDGPRPRLWRDLRLVARRDWRFLSVQVATFLNVSTEIWLAAALLTASEASWFSAGQRLALMLMIPLTALQVVVAPVVARAGADGVEGEAGARLQAVLRTCASLATALSLVILLPFVVAPGAILELVYGDGFRGAVPVLLLLSVGYLGNVATGMAGTTLSMLRREGVAARVQWLGAVLRVVLGVPAALLLGLWGLTFSALTVSVVVLTVMWWQTRRTVGLFTHATLRPQLGLLRRTPG